MAPKPLGSLPKSQNALRNKLLSFDFNFRPNKAVNCSTLQENGANLRKIALENTPLQTSKILPKKFFHPGKSTYMGHNTPNY